MLAKTHFIACAACVLRVKKIYFHISITEYKKRVLKYGDTAFNGGMYWWKGSKSDVAEIQTNGLIASLYFTNPINKKLISVMYILDIILPVVMSVFASPPKVAPNYYQPSPINTQWALLNVSVFSNESVWLREWFSDLLLHSLVSFLN